MGRIGPADVKESRVQGVFGLRGDDRIFVLAMRHGFMLVLPCDVTVAPGMKSRGGGAIVNLGSISWHLESRVSRNCIRR